MAPGRPNSAHMVANKSKQKPHFVSLTEDGRFQCDDACPSFHQGVVTTISAAEPCATTIKIFDRQKCDLIA